MPEHNSITGINGQEQPSVDINTLRRLGLESIIRTGSKYWTDYNEHDPGITILEVLIYALTDLGYRTNFPITDILAQQRLSAEELEQTQFYTARNILTVNPLTLLDFRKILVDQDGVNNAWVFPSQNSLEPISGLLDVVIDDHLEKDPKKQKALLKKVEHTIQEHRNLSQNINSVRVREALDVRFKIDLTINDEAAVEKTLAELLLALENYLSSTVYFLSFQEMMDKMDGNINAVFDGPPLRHGFLPDDAMLPRMENLQAVNLVPVVGALKDIQDITTLEFRTTLDDLSAVDQLSPPHYWFHTRKIPLDRKPVLAPIHKHQITVRRGNVVQRWTKEGVQVHLTNLRNARRMPKLAKAKRDVNIPEGDFRDITAYLTVQAEFPRIYGMPPHGAPPGASPEQLGKIKQLQAYLLFFDQLMANYLAQLANLGQLFSWSSEVSRTYFFQGLEQAVEQLAVLLTGYEKVQQTTSEQQRKKHLQQLFSQYEHTLGQLREDESTFLERRNLFLNHLLLRFGRNLDLFTDQLNSKTELSATTEHLQSKAQLETKLRVLQQYPFLSAKRGKGFSIGLEHPDFSHQFSGLRYWVETLFDMVPENLDVFRFNDRFLLDHFDEDNPQHNAASEYVIRSADGSPIKMKHLMKLGVDPANITIEAKEVQGKVEEFPYRIRIALNAAVTPVDSPIYLVEPIFKTAAAAEQAMTHINDLFQRYSKTSERIYVLEHLHLRPAPSERNFGLALLDEEGTSWMQTKDWHTQSSFHGLIEMAQRGYVYYAIDDLTQKNAEDEPTKPTASATPKPATPLSSIGEKAKEKLTELTDQPHTAPTPSTTEKDTACLAPPSKLHFQISSNPKATEFVIPHLTLENDKAKIEYLATQQKTPAHQGRQQIEKWLFRVAPVALQCVKGSNGQFQIDLSFLAQGKVVPFSSVNCYTSVAKAEEKIGQWTLQPSLTTFTVVKTSAPAGAGNYAVLLSYQNKNISIRFTSAQTFAQSKEAQKTAKYWQSIWNKATTASYPKGQCWQPLLLPWSPPGDTSAKLSADNPIFKNPYSFVLTIVAPQWPIRFQHENFRDALLKTLHSEAPAHLWLNVLWLDKIKFQRFQVLYGNWWRAFLAQEQIAIHYKWMLLDFIMEHSFTNPVSLHE